MIKPPNWCKDAKPTQKGWMKNGELLVAKRFTQQEINEYNGVANKPEPVVVEEVTIEEPQMLTEAPVSNKSLDKMTKAELVALGEQNGIELSMSSTKQVMLDVLNETL